MSPGRRLRLSRMSRPAAEEDVERHLARIRAEAIDFASQVSLSPMAGQQFQYGDHLMVRRPGYDHHGVYASDERVIDLGGYDLLSKHPAVPSFFRSGRILAARWMILTLGWML